MRHYVIIENLIIKQDHMKKYRCCQKKKYLKKTETENKTGLEANFQTFSHLTFRRAPGFGFVCNR